MSSLNIPNLPPLIFNGYSKYMYVFTYKNVWDPIKQKSKREKSKKIGAIVGGKDSKDGRIVFNDDFINQYPELKEIDVFRQNNKLVFKTKVDDDECTLAKIKATVKLHAGATHAFDEIIASTPIGRALQRVFSKYNRHKKLLSLAYFIVLNASNVMSDYEAFCECTKLPWQGVMNESTISKIFKSITEDEIEQFFKVLSDLYFKERNCKTKDDVFLALDSTSISSYSNNLSKADYGKNKDGDTLAQINVIFLVDQSTGLPLYYRLYDGPVPDVSTVRRTIADMTRLNLKSNIILVADKGYPSVTNIDDCMRTNTNYVFNIRVKNNNFTSQIIDENSDKFSDANNYDKYLESFVYTCESDCRYDEFPITNKRALKKERQKVFVHIFFNKHIYINECEAITHNVASAREKYNLNQSISVTEQYYLDNYCSIDEEQHIATIDNSKIKNRTQYSGFRVLLSDTIKDYRLAACAYRERNEVEYAFHTLKSRLNCNRFRTASDTQLEGKAFVQFIACSLSILIRKRLADTECFKTSNIKLSTEENKYALVSRSDHKVLQLLNNVFAIKDGNGYIFDEVVGKKKALFKKLGVSIPTSIIDNQNIQESDEILEDDLFSSENIGNIDVI